MEGVGRLCHLLTVLCMYINVNLPMRRKPPLKKKNIKKTSTKSKHSIKHNEILNWTRWFQIAIHKYNSILAFFTLFNHSFSLPLLNTQCNNEKDFLMKGGIKMHRKVCCVGEKKEGVMLSLKFYFSENCLTTSQQNKKL